MKYAMGVDIGGTKIAVGLVDEKGVVTNRLQVTTDTSSAEALFVCLTEAMQEVLKISEKRIEDLEGIGIGLPGKVDSKQGIAIYQNNLPWERFMVVKRLQEHFGDMKVRIDNDVKVAAFAEYKLQGVLEDEMFGYITISTGIAATNIINGTILRGSGFSGEIGFLQVPSFGEFEMLEKSCSGPAIERLAREKYQVESIRTKEVFERWYQNEEIAKEIMDEVIHGIVLATHSMICLLDPKVIVFGGSVSLHNPRLIEEVKLQLKELLHPEQYHVLENIRISTIKGDNGIIGAGLLML